MTRGSRRCGAATTQGTVICLISLGIAFSLVPEDQKALPLKRRRKGLGDRRRSRRPFGSMPEDLVPVRGNRPPPEDRSLADLRPNCVEGRSGFRLGPLTGGDPSGWQLQSRRRGKRRQCVGEVTGVLPARAQRLEVLLPLDRLGQPVQELLEVLGAVGEVQVAGVDHEQRRAVVVVGGGGGGIDQAGGGG